MPYVGDQRAICDALWWLPYVVELMRGSRQVSFLGQPYFVIVIATFLASCGSGGYDSARGLMDGKFLVMLRLSQTGKCCGLVGAAAACPPDVVA